MTFVSQTAATQPDTWDAVFVRLVERASTIFEWTVERQKIAEDRRKLKASLTGLSANHLRDIGLTEHDVISLDRRPLPSGEALEFTELRNLRSRNW